MPVVALLENDNRWMATVWRSAILVVRVSVRGEIAVADLANMEEINGFDTYFFRRGTPGSNV